jgi:hypothetical protein
VPSIRGGPVVAAALLALLAAACASAVVSPDPATEPSAEDASLAATARPTDRAGKPAGSDPGETNAAPVVAIDGSQATRVDTSFVSERYRYSLVVPPGWTINEVAGSGGLHPDEPGVDTFRDREGHILSVVGEPATSLAGWTSSISQHLRQDHALQVDSKENLTVAGVPARITEYHLPIPPSYLIHYLDTDLVRDGVGLVLSLESTTRDDPGDRAVLDRFLKSVDLTKAS